MVYIKANPRLNMTPSSLRAHNTWIVTITDLQVALYLMLQIWVTVLGLDKPLHNPLPQLVT